MFETLLHGGVHLLVSDACIPHVGVAILQFIAEVARALRDLVALVLSTQVCQCQCAGDRQQQEEKNSPQQQHHLRLLKAWWRTVKTDGKLCTRLEQLLRAPITIENAELTENIVKVISL